jgi:hypothetical protein
MFACDPAIGTIAVKALSAVPTIEVWKQLTPTLLLNILLPTGSGVSTGSPTTAFADNRSPIVARVVRRDANGNTHVIGRLRLVPGAAADVSVTPDAAGDDDQVVFTALGGQVTVMIGGSTRTVIPGSPLTVPLDRNRPRIEISRPATGARYLLNQRVAAAFSCADDASAIVACEGSAANGRAIDTSSIGMPSFGVFAADGAGNTETTEVRYDVTYAVKPQPAAPIGNRRQTVPIALQLTDAGGVNRSAAGLVVTALGVRSADGSRRIDLEGEAFRFDSTGSRYRYDFHAKDLAPGDYVLSFAVRGDPVEHTIGFSIR